MPVGIQIPQFTGDATREVRVDQLYGSKWTLLVTGDPDGGELTIEGGTKTVQEAVRVTNYSNPTVHTALAMTVVGVYIFDAVCEQLDFILTGSGSPALDLTLFPEARF